MENIRWIIEEVLDALNCHREMTGVMEALEKLNRKELVELEEALDIITTKTKNEVFILRLMSLKNQITMTQTRQFITQYKYHTI